MLVILLQFVVSVGNDVPYVLPQGLVDGVTKENQQWIISMIERLCPSNASTVTLRPFLSTMFLKTCLDVKDKNAIIQQFKTYHEAFRQQSPTSEPSAQQIDLTAWGDMAKLLQGNLDAISPSVWRDYAQYLISGMTSPMPESFLRVLINDVFPSILPPPFNEMKLSEDMFNDMVKKLHAIPAGLSIEQKRLKEDEIMKDAFITCFRAQFSQ